MNNSIWHLPARNEALRGRKDASKRNGLNFLNQVAHPDAKDFGNPNQGVHRNIFRPAFNGADINRMQISLFRELFLTKSGLLAISPDGSSKNSTIFQVWQHDIATRQETVRTN